MKYLEICYIKFIFYAEITVNEITNPALKTHLEAGNTDLLDVIGAELIINLRIRFKDAQKLQLVAAIPDFSDSIYLTDEVTLSPGLINVKFITERHYSNLFFSKIYPIKLFKLCGAVVKRDILIKYNRESTITYQIISNQYCYTTDNLVMFKMVLLFGSHELEIFLEKPFVNHIINTFFDNNSIKNIYPKLTNDVLTSIIRVLFNQIAPDVIIKSYHYCKLKLNDYCRYNISIENNNLFYIFVALHHQSLFQNVFEMKYMSIDNCEMTAIKLNFRVDIAISKMSILDYKRLLPGNVLILDINNTETIINDQKIIRSKCFIDFQNYTQNFIFENKRLYLDK
jgi:hypothetical protein